MKIKIKLKNLKGALAMVASKTSFVENTVICS